MPPMPGAPQQFHPGHHHMPGGMAPGMQSMSQPGSPAGGQPGSASRIDPNQIPRPQPTITSVNFDTRVNGQATLPPVSDDSYALVSFGFHFLLSFEHSHPLTNLRMFMYQVSTVFIAVIIVLSLVFKLHGIGLTQWGCT